MRCDAVRERLPGYVDSELRAVGPVELHLATCEACRAELDVYRRLHALLSEMATAPEPSDELLPELLSRMPIDPTRARAFTGTRSRYALASLGGAAVGATAIAIVWWRRARRPHAEPAKAAV
jgi:predicted anti-sigma-YlaC factor YlaD